MYSGSIRLIYSPLLNLRTRLTDVNSCTCRADVRARRRGKVGWFVFWRRKKKKWSLEMIDNRWRRTSNQIRSRNNIIFLIYSMCSWFRCKKKTKTKHIKYNETFMASETNLIVCFSGSRTRWRIWRIDWCWERNFWRTKWPAGFPHLT